jgi:hypothetical protein
VRIGQEFKKINPNTKLIVSGAIVGETGGTYIVKCIGGASEEYITKDELLIWEDVDSNMLYDNYLASSFMETL